LEGRGIRPKNFSKDKLLVHPGHELKNQHFTDTTGLMVTRRVDEK
jgi:hypothetical protein